MKIRIRMIKDCSIACFLFAAAVSARAQEISFTQIPPGYDPGSVTLPEPFTGALGVDPNDDQTVYASVGSFGNMRIARVDLAGTTSTLVASGPFGGIQGIVPISATRIVLIENDDGGGATTDTIILASDINPEDGDFDDPGEISELIAPILTHPTFGFTGGPSRLVPPGNPSGIPSGSIIVQTSDGGGNAELLVITDPLGTPAFRPLGGPYYAGFEFGGGVDFDPLGRVIMGTLTSSFTGEVHALVNTNADEDIDAGEANAIAFGENGIYELTTDGEGLVYFTGDDGSFGFNSIRRFTIPDDPLAESASPVTFAKSDSSFLTGVLVNSKTKSFAPGSGPGGAVLIAGGSEPAAFPGAPNLLTLTPNSALLSAREWERLP